MVGIPRREEFLGIAGVKSSPSPTGGVRPEFQTMFLRAPLQNMLLSRNSTDDGNECLSATETLRRFRNGNISLIRENLSDGYRVDYGKDAVQLSTTPFVSLQMHVDSDSMDFVTEALGGMVFKFCTAAINMLWFPSFIQENVADTRRNGLVGFWTAYSPQYPGNYFALAETSGTGRNRYGRKNVLEPCYPVQVDVISVQLG